MTGKRFQYNVNKNSIEYDGKHFAYCNGEQSKIVKKLNELNDGNISLIEDEIDKKIALLTDAKIKSFQNEDEELLMKIKFSIQVLRELKERIKEL